MNPSRFIAILIAAALLIFCIKFFPSHLNSTVSAEGKNATSSESTTTSDTTAPTTTPATVAPIPATVASDDPQVQAQLQILSEILKSKNDNDPRMDRELKVLSEKTKAKFREAYKALPAESRNDRGTIVFLLGRNISNEADLKFFDEVLGEVPCKSIQDCSKDDPGTAHRDHEEHQGGMAVALAYPQMVTVHSLRNYLEKNPNGPVAEKIQDLIAQAKHSAIPEVSKMASEAIKAAP
ncbi:MAG: hypothetical protein J7501_05420 [Bdellovibrio sp.]|nr:hypothetical protein [Bdellovibrio sp.]